MGKEEARPKGWREMSTTNRQKIEAGGCVASRFRTHHICYKKERDTDLLDFPSLDFAAKIEILV